MISVEHYVIISIEQEINGETLQCTETHPFQVKGKGWVDASNLNPGDIVYTKDWHTATVERVSLLELPEPAEVFNFEVEDSHTYFIGETDILVHNASCHLSKEWRAERRCWKNEGLSYQGNAKGQLSRSGNYNVTEKIWRECYKGRLQKALTISG